MSPIDWSQLVTPEAKAQQAAIAARQAWKSQRADAVSAITVTTSTGNRFDGDETSQGRMARSIAAMEPGETITWVLADNTPVDIGRDELREALRLAGAEQARLWVPPTE